MSASAQLDVGDADLGIPLPVPGLAAIVLPPLELEYVDLGLFALSDNLRQDLGAFDQGSTSVDGLAVGRQQDLVEGDLSSGLGAHERQPEGLPLLRPKLLPCGAKDRVHTKILN